MLLLVASCLFSNKASVTMYRYVNLNNMFNEWIHVFFKKTMNIVKCLIIIGLLFCNTINAQTTKSMWVGESYQCDATSALLGLISDMSWTTNGGYFSLSGSGGYRTVTVTQFFLGTASVTCSWKYRLYSNDQWKTQSKTWYFTCQENPISIAPTTMTLTVGENRYVSYSHLYDNNYVSYSNAYFESNNNTVATVSNSGLVTAVSPGTAYVVVYSKLSQPSSCKVIVTDNGHSDSDDIVPPTIDTDYEIVDLGLSVNWASHNLGATSSEEDGNYYAWGEIVSKKTFNSSNCSTLELNAFNIYSVDKRGDWVLPSNYDAAYCSWGKQWRIPTHREFKELIDNCKWVWITKNGRNGYEITGPNGNKIFLPASGFYEGNINNYKNVLGIYLHSTIYSSHYCGGISFRNDDIWGWDSGERFKGCSIRPVTEVTPKVIVTSIILNALNLEMITGDCATLVATVSPNYATDSSVTWNSNDTAVAIVNENGVVTAVAPGIATITASANDKSGVSASCEVKVIPVPVTGITLNSSLIQFEYIGETANLEATVLPDDAANKKVRWTSSDESVCIVSNGMVVAVGMGTSVIIATTEDGGFTAVCVVTVTSETGISSAEENDGLLFQIYNINGMRRKQPQQGVNIIRNANGTTKKVLIKH